MYTTTSANISKLPSLFELLIFADETDIFKVENLEGNQEVISRLLS